jgi:predicted MFS family arabinose efflux permease
MSATQTAPTSAPHAAGALATLRSEPAYARLLLGGFMSGIGDWFNTVALMGLLLRLTGSPLAIGVSLAIRSAPRLLLAPVAGTLADRAPRKWIVAVCDLLSALVALSFLLVTDASRVWIVWAGLTGLVILSAFRGPARTGVTPALVKPESLAGANALEGMSSGSVMLLGAAVGGAVSGWLGPGPAFIMNAASFAISALLTISVAIPRAAPSRSRGFMALREAPAIIQRSPPLRLLLTLAILWPVGGGATNTLITVYGVQVFHAGDRGIGTLYATIGVGLLLGGLIAPRFAQRPQLALAVAFVADGLAQVAASRAPILALAALGIGLSTVAAGIGNASASTVLMRESPPDAIGRVFAIQDALSSVTFTLSVLASGALLSVIQPRTLGALAGAIIALGGLLVALAARQTLLDGQIAVTRETGEVMA